MRWPVVLAALVAVLAPAAAAGAPALADGTVSPSAWSGGATAAVSWSQHGFDGADLGPALVQVRVDGDGAGGGEWRTLRSIPGPLASGPSGDPALPVGELEGRHEVRVVVEGADASPLRLGLSLRDATPPVVNGVAIQYDDAVPRVSWSQGDALSGIDGDAGARLEVNLSPHGDAGGPWFAVAGSLDPEGRGTAAIDTEPLAEGDHLARVVVADRAGNVTRHPVGAVHADRRPPGVAVAVLRPPTSEDPTFELLIDAADPEPGSGIAADATVELRSADALRIIGSSILPHGRGHIVVSVPTTGSFELAVRVADRAGRLGESQTFAVVAPGRSIAPAPPVWQEPSPAPAPGPMAAAAPTPMRPPEAGEPLGRGARAAHAAVRRLHARRGMTLSVRLLTARDGGAWERLLGMADAHRYAGYTTFRGEVLLGPAATAGLETLERARRPAAAGGRRPEAAAPSTLELDRMAMALGVLLHETLHATGPAAVEDIRAGASGRAFEEGFTEAVTIDRLPDLVRELALPPRLAAPLVAAARRYRPSRPAAVAWARRMSARATAAGPASAAARRFRGRVADTWGPERWRLLAEATGRTESELRAGAAATERSARGSR